MYFLSDSYLYMTGLLEKNSPGERQGSMEGMGRKIQYLLRVLPASSSLVWLKKPSLQRPRHGSPRQKSKRWCRLEMPAATTRRLT